MREAFGLVCLTAAVAAAVVLVVVLVRRRAAPVPSSGADAPAPLAPDLSLAFAPGEPAPFGAAVAVAAGPDASQTVALDGQAMAGPRDSRRRLVIVVAAATAALAVAAAVLLVPAHYTITLRPVGQVVAAPGSRLAVSVTNAGLLSGTWHGRVTVDGVAQDGVGTTLAGRAARTLDIVLPASLTAGRHTVVVAGASLVVTALTPASFHVTALTCDPDGATVHDTVAVSAEVTNEGQATGVFPGELKVDGKTVDAQPAKITGGAVTTVSFEVKRTRPGYYTLRLGDATPVTIPIVKPVRPVNGAVLTRSTSGDGQLVFKNKMAEDLVGVLSADAKGGRHPALAFYVRAKSSTTVDRIADGQLYVYFESGREWNHTTDGFLVTDDRERFKHTAQFSTSSWTTSYTDWSKWTIYTTEHTQYTQWVISVSDDWVYGPPGGSVEVSAARFPKI